jgi:hypothetical protein
MQRYLSASNTEFEKHPAQAESPSTDFVAFTQLAVRTGDGLATVGRQNRRAGRADECSVRTNHAPAILGLVRLHFRSVSARACW